MRKYVVVRRSNSAYRGYEVVSDVFDNAVEATDCSRRMNEDRFCNCEDRYEDEKNWTEYQVWKVEPMPT